MKKKSGGSVHKILIDDSSALASFIFTGTGFELIARTDASESGTIIVTNKDGEQTQELNSSVESSATISRHILDLEIEKIETSESAVALFSSRTATTSSWTIPVIMEFDNGANGGEEVIHQVPVIRKDDLSHGTYKVTIKGVPANTYDENGNKTGTRDTYLYLDGVRIYQPMGETNKNYTADENGAVFYELRDQIMDGYAAAVQYNNSGNLLISTGTTTWVEKYSEKYTANQVTSVYDYLFRGPNNEVYMIGNENASAVVFYVKETTDAATHSLQIALRSIDLGYATVGTPDKEPTVVWYGIKDGESVKWTPMVTTSSGTEQYYTIDYTKCPTTTVEGETCYQIAVRVEKGMVSYSSLKLVGLELMGLPDSFAYSDGTTLYYDEGILKDSAPEADMMNTYGLLRSISAQMNSTVLAPIPAPPVPLGPNGGDGGYVRPEEKPEVDDPAKDDKDDADDDDDVDDNDDRRDSSPLPNLNLLTLTVKAGEGGSISPEGSLLIAFGAGRTFTLTPDEGYEIADLLVNGKSVGAVEKYTIKAAATNTIVEAKFRKIETTENP